MKKLLVLMMAITLSLSLAACGEDITLQRQTVNDITLDIPSDFGEFNEVAEQIYMAKNEDSTATITISERVDAQGITPDLWDEEAFVANVMVGFNEPQVLEFSNTETALGTAAVYARYTGRNSSDVEVEGYSYILYFDDGTYQSVAFSFTKDKDSALKQNLTSIIDSMKKG